MKILKILGCMALTLVLMGTLYCPGVRVVVSGKALPGVYDPAVVARCATAAHAAAEEICRENATSDYKLIPVFTARWTQPQELQLTRVLLESYNGVERVYQIRVGDAAVGSVPTLGDAYALYLRYPHLPLSVTPTYTYADAGSSVQAVIAQLENYTENVTAPF